MDAPVPLVALIGAPRSGTTWLQNLLGADRRIVSPQETSLFARFVAPLDESWRWGLRGTVDDWAKRRFIGLGAVLTEEEFTTIVRGFVQQVLCRVIALKPGASVVVEKTPLHSLHVELIARYAPQVRFLHIIRDGRDVAASLVEASKGWGTSWGAPATVSRAASTWTDYVEGARRAQTAAPYFEIRYSDLQGDGADGQLAQIFEFCGVPIDIAEARRRLDEYSLARQRSNGTSSVVFGGEAARHAGAGSEPEGFLGRGHAGSWREWSLRERVEFDLVAGPLLRDLGYEGDDSWIGAARAVASARRSFAARGRVSRFMRAVGRRVERAGDRVGNQRS